MAAVYTSRCAKALCPMAQLPRFVLDRLDDLRPGILPTLEQFVDFLFAVEIQPDDHRDATVLAVVIVRSPLDTGPMRRAAPTASDRPRSNSRTDPCWCGTRVGRTEDPAEKQLSRDPPVRSLPDPIHVSVGPRRSPGHWRRTVPATARRRQRTAAVPGPASLECGRCRCRRSSKDTGARRFGS